MFPPEPESVTGELIWKNILQLQNELTEKRNAAINLLLSAMSQLYPEQEPALVAERARDIAKLYQKERFANKKELNNMSQITAESSNIFPPDFVSATPECIVLNSNAFFKRSTTAK